MPTGIIQDRRYLDHDMGAYHVESPLRIAAILDMLDENPDLRFQKIEPRKAEKSDILRIHTQEFFHRIQQTAGKKHVILDPDTSTSALSFDTALLAAGGLLECADKIQDGTIANAFAPVRPPGHHAESDRAMGFCLFNNIAVTAEYLKFNHNLDRILIIDWDLHHGNGTQNSFFNRSDVMYISIHQYPHYPGTGHWNQTGRGKGEGFTVNIPLSAGKTDSDYLYIFHTLVGPAAAAFQPQFILVSAGFDIAADDPLGGMSVKTEGFGALTDFLIKTADLHCEGKILIALEGGYSINALKAGSLQVIRALNRSSPPHEIRPECSPTTLRELGPVFQTHHKYRLLNQD